MNDLKSNTGSADEAASSLSIPPAILKLGKQSYEPKELERLGLTPDPEQRDSILAYLGLVLKNNAALEFVPKDDESHLFLRHFCDSLQLLLLLGFKKNASVFDIGSGAGFPAVPIRIFRPDLSFTLIESSPKKAAFLKEAVKAAGLDDVEVHVGKAEGFSSEKKADYVIGRGMGTLQKFAQLAKPHLSDDGRIYTYIKPKQLAAELDAITENKAAGGVGVSEIAEYDLGTLVRGLNLVSLALV